MPQARSVAIVGAGWSGIAAAVQATLVGHSVTLFEMAKHCGGRARDVDAGGMRFDNGQHIMIGAYTEVLRLMGIVGANAHQLLLRTPLEIRGAAGAGLTLRPGPPLMALTLAVARHDTWRWRDKFALIAEAARWALQGFNCPAALDVATLTRRLPSNIRGELIDPLCVAALNTPSGQASARVFLRVLQDALFASPGSSDLLLPRTGLSDVFPLPALQWLRSRGAVIHASTRVDELQSDGLSWRVDGKCFDRVVLAATAHEAARLAEPHAGSWAQVARKLPFEPIVTVYARCPQAKLPRPMLALESDAVNPAQFVFDRGQLGGPEGLLAFVISGAGDWVNRGAANAAQACLAQAAKALRPWLPGPLQTVQVLTERRATFRCIPDLERPAMHVAAGLCAAGDYVAGPYPATLEGAVRSGVNAIHAIS